MASFTLLALLLFCGLFHGSFGKPNQEKGCGSAPADIGFILDESGSIWSVHYKMQLQFVIDVVEMFHIGPQKTRIAVLTFADDARTIFDFEEHTIEKSLTESIGKIGQRRGQTATDQALDMARVDMFQGHMREGVAHVAIVITDGDSDNPDKTKEAARKLRELGITVIAVGVGRVKRTELENIASAPADEHVFEVDNYDVLESLKEKLAWKACKVTTPAPPTTTTTPTTTTRPQHIEDCSGTELLDVLFGLPPSAGLYHTDLTMDFFQAIASRLKINPEQTLAGLAPRVCSRMDGIGLSESGSNGEFSSALNARRREGSANHVLLKYVAGPGFLYQPAREAPVRTVVLVLDNNSEDPSAAFSKAEQLRLEGVRVIVVAVGEFGDTWEATELAYSATYVIRVPSYEDLGDFPQEVTRLLCDSISTST